MQRIKNILAACALATLVAALGAPVSAQIIDAAFNSAGITINTAGATPFLEGSGPGGAVTRADLRDARDHILTTFGGPGTTGLPLNDNISGIEVFFDYDTLTVNGQDDIIVLCVSTDGSSGSTAAANANGDNCSVYAVGGDGTGPSGHGGDATAEATGADSLAFAWGGDGSGGDGGFATALADGNATALGGESGGDGGGAWAESTAGDAVATGGASTGNGDGGDATAIADTQEAMATGGEAQGSGKGGDAYAEGAGADAFAFGGDSDTGRGGDAEAYHSGTGGANAWGGNSLNHHDTTSEGGNAMATSDFGAAFARGGKGTNNDSGPIGSQSISSPAYSPSAGGAFARGYDSATAIGGNGNGTHPNDDSWGGFARAEVTNSSTGNTAEATGGEGSRFTGGSNLGTGGRAEATRPNAGAYGDPDPDPEDSGETSVTVP
jgi:hypothetical protein